MILPITHSLLSICGPQTAESAGKKTELKMIRMILSCKEAAARTVAGCMQRYIHLQLDVMQELHRTADSVINSDSVVTVSAAGCH